MAIRCAELSIPAVIGCGEQIFNQIKEGKEIFIDCSSSLIFSDKFMKKIAISQRLELSKYNELRCQLDIKLNSFISQCGFLPVQFHILVQKKSFNQ